MKSLYAIVFVNLVFYQAFSQPENRELIAYYPLMGNLADSTGNNADLEVLNIDVRDSAVYSDGANSFSDTANRILVRLPALDLDDIYFSLDFQLDSAVEGGVLRSVIVGGSGWRWLAATYTQEDKELQFRYNNFNGPQGAFPFEYHQWYNLVISYQRHTQTGTMYIDGVSVATAQFDLNTSIDRTLVLDCFCGTHAMAGFWRNLRVYGPDTTLQIEPLDLSCEINRWTSDENSLDGDLNVRIQGGTPPHQVFTSLNADTIELDSNAIHLSGFGIGEFEIFVRDQNGIVESCRAEFLPPPTDLRLISDYPLLMDASDRLGRQEDLQVTNVPLNPESGYFSEGHPDPDTFNQIFGLFPALDPDLFYLSLEVKLDSIEDDPFNNYRNLFVMGTGLRWLAPAYAPASKTFILYHNNWNLVPGISQPFIYDRWYEIGLSYSRSSGIVQMFVDRVLIGEVPLDLNSNNDRSFGLWCNCGPDPMRGYWRRLKIYGKDETTAVESQDQESLVVFPNPVRDRLIVDLKEMAIGESTVIRIFHSDGRIMYQNAENKSTDKLSIETSSWIPGIYVILVGNKYQSFLKL